MLKRNIVYKKKLVLNKLVFNFYKIIEIDNDNLKLKAIDYDVKENNTFVDWVEIVPNEKYYLNDLVIISQKKFEMLINKEYFEYNYNSLLVNKRKIVNKKEVIND